MLLHQQLCLLLHQQLYLQVNFKAIKALAVAQPLSKMCGMRVIVCTYTRFCKDVLTLQDHCRQDLELLYSTCCTCLPAHCAYTYRLEHLW